MRGQQPLSPYRPGVQLAIQAHTPPHPFSERYGNEDTIRSPVRGLPANGIDRLDFALSNPPLETPRPEQTKLQVLTILKEIIDRRQVGVGGPHLVSCYLDSDESRHYVAKIYDGIDYPFTDDWGFDCMYLADQDYSCEAAAYQSMPLCLQGSIVPSYFGSWTFSVETGLRRCPHRCVRLILLEHVDGECMLDMILRAKGVTHTNLPAELVNTFSIDYRLLPPEPTRLNVLVSIIEAEIALFEAGIAHRDVAPRNVLISRSPKRVVLIDFNRSLVYKYFEFGRKLLKSRDPDALPISPIERYWGWPSFVDEFGGWIPQTWLADDDGVKEWLCKRWGASTEFRSLSKNFLRTWGDHPLLRTVM